MRDDGQHERTNVDEKSGPNVCAPKRSWMRWLLPAAALLAAIALGVVLYGKLRDDVWAYYTDDEGLKVAVEEKKERMVLWEDPQQHLFQEQPPDVENPDVADPINQASERVEAAFSADGAMMVLTRWSKDEALDEADDTGADLYYATWDGRIWSRPVPMVGLNTAANERGAAFSRDGQYLYFSSDREGGAGGYDIYVARSSDHAWTAAEPLSDAVNSPQNETGPAPSTDGKSLYFSSDRDSGNKVHDIYVAHRVVPEAEGAQTEAAAEAASELPPVPVYTQAESVSKLNSTADDVEAALTRRGDHVFLASDRDRDDQSGFHLYLSRVIDGRVREPQRVEVYIQRGNATDPAVRMDGFDLLFSADGDLAAGPQQKPEPAAATAAAKPGYRLYRSTTREVIGYTDLSRWELFEALISKIIWWILLAIAALIALIYLLEQWRDITNLYHKCLAASVMAHLLLLFLMMSWLISQALDEGGDQQSPDVALSVDALAQEELAMESEQDLTQVADTTRLIVTKTVQDFREVAFHPTDTVSVPVIQQTSDQSLVSNFMPSKASESTSAETLSQPKADALTLTELSPTELPALQVDQLEVAQAKNVQAVEPVDTTKDDFKRDEAAIQQVITDKVAVSEAKVELVDVPSAAVSVVTSREPEVTTDAVSPVGSLEAEDSPQNLEGESAEQALASSLPGTSTADGLAEGQELEVAAVDPGKGNFQGDERAIGQVRSGKADIGGAGNQNVNVQSGADSVGKGGPTASTLDTGGDTVNPTDGLEAEGMPPELGGIDVMLALAANLPGSSTFDAFPRGDKLETPKHGFDPKALSQYIKKQSGKPSLTVIEQLGGSTGTERAIGMGLDWFSNHQEPDGRWEMAKHGSKSEYNTAGAGLGLLSYYGWGIKHGRYSQNSKFPRHSQAATKALDWLLKQQKEDGDLRGPPGQYGMYCHGIAAIALCEAYGLTKDPQLKEPATKAIDFILKAQHAGGGWRYRPGEAGDLSVTGWQHMALHSARMADLKVPDEAFEKTGRFLDSISAGKHGGLYGYTGRDTNKVTMTATGMFLRQLDLVPPTDPRMQEGAGAIKAQMIKPNRVDFYLDYYATLALYQHQGPIWEEWNENLKEVYVTLQKTSGSDQGSWDPKGNHVNTGGRVLATGLAILSLEVYYRLLPLYGFDRDEVAGPLKGKSR